MRIYVLLSCLLCLTPLAKAQEIPLSPTVKLVPGIKPTPFLRYINPTATVAEVSGTWNQWTRSFPMTRNGSEFVLDVRTLPIPRPGRYEFKFIANGAWETGDNRVMVINDDRVMERPPDVVMTAQLDARDEINIYLKRPLPDERDVKVRLEPEVPVREVQFKAGRKDTMTRGYLMAGGVIKFILDERIYGLNLSPTTLVAVAGNFNDWNGSGGRNGVWRLTDDNDDHIWELAMPLEGLNYPDYDDGLQFRFVLNTTGWLDVPLDASNTVINRSNNRNLQINPNEPGAAVIRVITEKPLNLSQSYTVVLDGVAPRRVRQVVSPGRVMDTLVSDKPLGATLDRERGITTYRLFAPRARSVTLNLFATPEFEVQQPAYRRLPPAERYAMWKDEADGVWEISLLGLDVGRYYSYNVDGPTGDGEGFNGMANISDPYSYASAHSQNNSIVIDREATNQWFTGWTDQDWKIPAREDMIIAKVHVRNMTIHPSSGVAPQLRATYSGIVASDGTGTGLDHLRNLGVNMIEFLPTQEFENGTRNYNWGYNTVHYFAPEASYGRQPLKGSQYYEYKSMINDLHRRGFGVIMDVVYNHVGGPNLFSMIDKKYFFRLTPDYKFINFSACGNDVKTESPMMRRFIVENCVYWVKEHHVDGFRFDLAELVDNKTLMAVRDAVWAINSNVVLIAEPWSIRAQNKEQLTGTGWAAWNNDFRYASKDFARGKANRDWLKKIIVGSTDIWTANPMQAVNYAESHDDMALVDELSLRPDRNGKYVQSYEVAMNKLVATMIFTSLGIPMIHEGQDFLRSKYGIHNTYDKGDAVNAVRWTDRERPLAKENSDYYRDLIALRKSEPGRAFRVREKAPTGYYQWITPENTRAMGYIVNAPRIHAGNGFVVLLNAADEAVEFPFTLPEGRWRVIGDHGKVDLAGLPGRDVVNGGQQVKVRVKEMSSLILMDGF